jgi:glutaredoxin-like protein NrdH
MKGGMSIMPDIKVYTTGPSCVSCQATKYWLRKRDIPFTEVRLDHDPKAAVELKQRGYTISPVVELHRDNGAEVWWSGHSPSRLESITNEPVVGGAK